MTPLRKAVPKFFLLVPLHAVEMAMGWFLVGTGIWIALDIELFRHPLHELLALTQVNAFWVGLALIVLGLGKAWATFLDFCRPTEVSRRMRVAIALATLVAWALVLVNGLVWHGGILLLRYTVLFNTELWTIVTGARSRPGVWE